MLAAMRAWSPCSLPRKRSRAAAKSRHSVMMRCCPSSTYLKRWSESWGSTSGPSARLNVPSGNGSKELWSGSAARRGQAAAVPCPPAWRRRPAGREAPRGAKRRRARGHAGATHAGPHPPDVAPLGAQRRKQVIQQQLGVALVPVVRPLDGWHGKQVVGVLEECLARQHVAAKLFLGLAAAAAARVRAAGRRRCPRPPPRAAGSGLRSADAAGRCLRAAGCGAVGRRAGAAAAWPLRRRSLPQRRRHCYRRHWASPLLLLRRKRSKVDRAVQGSENVPAQRAR